MQAARLLLASRGVAATPEALAVAYIEAETMLLRRAYYAAQLGGEVFIWPEP